MPLGLAPLFVKRQRISNTAGGETITFDIPNDFPVAAFSLRAVGAIEVGVANADGLRSGGAANFFRRVRILAKGEQRLDLAGRKLRLHHQLMNQGAITETQPDVAVASQPFTTTMARQFQMPRLVIPLNDKGILPNHIIRDVQVVVDVAPPSDILEPAGATTLAYNAATDVEFAVIQAPAAGGLPYVPQDPAKNFFVNEQLFENVGDEATLLTSTGRKTIRLNVDGHYRYIALMCEADSGVGGTRVFRNDLIDEIRLLSNRSEIFKARWNHLQADNGVNFLLPNANPPLDGIAVLDWTRFATPQELLDANFLKAQGSDLTLEIEVVTAVASARFSVIASRLFGLVL